MDTVFEQLCRYYTARNEMRAAYDAIGVAGRMHLRRGSKAARAVAEYTVFKMQHKVSLARMGLTQNEARRLPGDVWALHMDRHRQLESLALRDKRNA